MSWNRVTKWLELDEVLLLDQLQRALEGDANVCLAMANMDYQKECVLKILLTKLAVQQGQPDSLLERFELQLE